MQKQQLLFLGQLEAKFNGMPAKSIRSEMQKIAITEKTPDGREYCESIRGTRS